jgi:hypothetical protein
MITRRLVFFLSALALPVAVALATSNYEYGPDEYVIVARGVSPDGKFAITAHGSGYLGYDNFHLYLTDAGTGKTIYPLKEIVDTRDTGAAAFAAKWSADAKEVTIIYRVGRPLKAVTYRIDGRQAQRISGPFDANKGELLKYWQTHSSRSEPSPKVFGSPLKHDPNA